MAKKVSIQGFEGSFHQQAAIKYYGKKTEVIPCATFKEVITHVKENADCDAGMMAIENSIAGSILPNYTLIQNSGLVIVGEVYLQIDQHLLANPGVELEDIKEVHSHPMAILQCRSYLDHFNWKLVETEDTALSARHIHQHRNKHTAAIAGKVAADLFGLNILAKNIHTLKNNYTRFLVLQRKEEAAEVESPDKASINFKTDHSKGSLAKVLVKIAEADINLSKLQSFPIPGSKFNYSFHADLEFDEQKQFDKVLEKITPLTKGVNVYGVYKNGNKNRK